MLFISLLIFIKGFPYYLHVFRDNCVRWGNVTSALDLGKGEWHGSMKQKISPLYAMDIDADMS